MNNSNVQNRSTHLRIWLEDVRGMLPNELRTYILHEWADKKWQRPPTLQTILNWIDDRRGMYLSLDQWQIFAEILGLSIDDLRVLKSGCIGCKTYSQKEIKKIMGRRRSIKDPNFDLRYLIELSDFSQTSLAKELGGAFQTVANWCAGDSEPNATTGIKVKQLLNATDTEMLTALANARPASKNPCPVKVSAIEQKKIKKIA